MGKWEWVIQLLGTGTLIAFVNAVASGYSKKRERQAGNIDGRLQDWRERSEQSDKRIAILEHKIEELQRERAEDKLEFAALGRDFAGLEQYTAALEVTVRKLDPSAQIPPRPHRSRRE